MANYVITSARLGFRPWKSKDLTPLLAINQDPRVMEYFPKLLDKRDTQDFIQRQQQLHSAFGYCFFAVERLDSNAFIGIIGLSNFTFHKWEGIEIGWRLAHAHWNLGFATEGAKKLLQWSKQHCSTSNIYSFTAKVNLRSEHVMKKIGMEKVREFDHPKIDRNHTLSRHVLYQIANT